MNCFTKPDNMVAIAISPETDTYANIKETRQFTIGIPKDNILDKLYKAGEKVDKNVSEFEFTNLTPYDSKKLKCKRIEECIVNIDCVFENEIETGNHHIIVGKVVACDIDEDKYSEAKDFKDKVALVTGETSGIGKEIAKQLLINDAKVIINYAHNEENCENAKKEFEKYKEKVSYIKADVSN